MNTIFMNSKISKTFGSHKHWHTHLLLLNITDKIDLRRKYNYIALSRISIYHTWKNIKKSYKNNKFKILAPTLMENLNCLMDQIL